MLKVKKTDMMHIPDWGRDRFPQRPSVSGGQQHTAGPPRSFIHARDPPDTISQKADAPTGDLPGKWDGRPCLPGISCEPRCPAIADSPRHAAAHLCDGMQIGIVVVGPDFRGGARGPGNDQQQGQHCVFHEAHAYRPDRGILRAGL